MNAARRRSGEAGPGRLVRTALVGLALVLGLGAGAVATPAEPAQAAGTYVTICLPVYEEGKLIDFHCHDFTLPVEVDPCDDCPIWGFGFTHLVLPSDPWYGEDVRKGMSLLEQAAATEDREAARRLRAAAQEAFLAAAERLGDNQVRLGESGTVDLERKTIEPPPVPWLEAAGTDVGNGLNLLRRALTEPDPQPWLEAGMAAFEEAYQEIYQQRPIGR